VKTLYWVRNDLRLHDNLALRRATFGSETLDFVYSIDRSLATAARHRKAFWFESLWQFQQSLGAYGQFLNLTHLPISEFIDSSNDLTRVVASRSYNFKDQQTEKALQQVCTRHDIELELVDQAPLILAEQLPIDLAKLKSFTPFRKKIESSVSPRDPLPAPESLAPFSLQNSSELQTMGSPSLKLFPAGEKAALARLDHYLWRSKKALTYKETRNGMVEFDDSTKFSPYLAVGSLSPRKIYQELKKFESEIEANESTYWIYFELLWRDFFKYYSLKHGEKLFQLAGPKQTQLDWEVGLQLAQVDKGSEQAWREAVSAGGP
jgi:deoxyribodipyrimidine photo-lyase